MFFSFYFEKKKSFLLQAFIDSKVFCRVKLYPFLHLHMYSQIYIYILIDSNNLTKTHILKLTIPKAKKKENRDSNEIKTL